MHDRLLKNNRIVELVLKDFRANALTRAKQSMTRLRRHHKRIQGKCPHQWDDV
jgi:hypothetical protein